MPLWVIEKVLPAMVIVPVRDVMPELASTEYPTVPLPLPVDPEVTEIQTALLAAVQEHPEVAVTEILPAAEDAVKDLLVGESA